MAYKLAFYTLLALWIWEANTLANQSMAPAWIAGFSLGCGYLSQVLFARGWKHSW